jgi:purine-binding chemotaxis protein CheW
MAEKRQYTSGLIEDLFVGIRVEAVQEVAGECELTPVPHAPSCIGGLLNLRGQIVTAIDLRRCLQVGDRPAGQPPVNLILRTDDGCVSLLMDQVGDVLEVDDHDFESAPSTLDGRLRELIAGVYKLDGRLLLVLDTDKVLALSLNETT